MVRSRKGAGDLGWWCFFADAVFAVFVGVLSRHDWRNCFFFNIFVSCFLACCYIFLDNLFEFCLEHYISFVYLSTKYLSLSKYIFVFLSSFGSLSNVMRYIDTKRSRTQTIWFQKKKTSIVVLLKWSLFFKTYYYY